MHFSQAGPRYYQLDASKQGYLKDDDIERVARFAGVTGLLPRLDRSILQRSLQQNASVKGFTYENIQPKTAELKIIFTAIDTGHFIQFEYRKLGKNTHKKYIIAPYHLINKNGIWYVIGLDGEQQKTFCFNQTKQLKQLSRTFTINPDISARIKQSDSLHHCKESNIAIIEIGSQVAEYFQRRALLPNQTSLTPQENGDLHITCENVHSAEIIAIVQYWLPHAKIIEPQQWQETIISHLNQYLNSTIL